MNDGFRDIGEDGRRAISSSRGLVWQVGCAAHPGVAADLALACARNQAAERQYRWPYTSVVSSWWETPTDALRVAGPAVQWHTRLMAIPAIDVERLTRDEQLELLDKLWDSLGRDPEALPLSEEQRRDLDVRLDELEQDGASGLSWDEAAGQIRSK
jgi:putative addiction module component (TIGR02574 family)